jgi:hypothetical protein
MWRSACRQSHRRRHRWRRRRRGMPCRWCCVAAGSGQRSCRRSHRRLSRPGLLCNWLSRRVTALLRACCRLSLRLSSRRRFLSIRSLLSSLALLFLSNESLLPDRHCYASHLFGKRFRQATCKDRRGPRPWHGVAAPTRCHRDSRNLAPQRTTPWRACRSSTLLLRIPATDGRTIRSGLFHKSRGSSVDCWQIVLLTLLRNAADNRTALLLGGNAA